MSSAWSGWVGQFQGIKSLDTRAVLSVLILGTMIFLVRWVAPAVLEWMELALGGVLEQEDVTDRAEAIRDFTPWWVSRKSIVRILQLFLLGFTAIVLVTVWGHFTLLLALVDVLSVSMPVVVQIVVTVVIFLLAYVLIDVIGTWLSGVTTRSEGISEHQEEIAFRVLQIVVFTGVLLAAMTLWGVNLGGLLVGAGFLGIVVGMAARQTLGSLIAGFVLMFSRPFEIGDWIEIGDMEGIVTEISIVNTRLENFDGEVVVIPNDVVSNSTIVNRSRKGRLRVRVEVGIDYDADPERAESLAVEALKEVDRILSVPRPRAVTKQLGDSAVVIELRFWIDKPSARRRARATSDAIRAVKDAYDDAGIKIPYPQRELLGREEAGGFRIVDGPGGEE
ncbi:MAG: mechanosensitive ion channel family protein [Halodesulfurarchaeum sp.]